MSAVAASTSIRNSHSRYGSVAKTFHWLTALLIVTLIVLGMTANALPYDTNEELARKALLFSLHKTLGVTVFVVALARIGWAVSQPKPAALHPDRKAETFLAEVVHWLLYGSLVLVPLTGWIHHAATSGFAPIWWPLGQSLPLVPKNEGVAHIFAALHIIFLRVLVLSILLHVLGALKHHLVDKDATLRRMWFGTPVSPATPRSRRHGAGPVGSAIGIYAAALGIGTGLGLFESKSFAAPAPALSQVASDWQVQDGKIGISITQFGNTVTGSFSDWTAAIRFDEAATVSSGDVEATIAIGSISLGSVTSQALGSDFFDAQAFPTAVFRADIRPEADAYLAEGSLILKGSEIPVSLPFKMTIVDGTASMVGKTTLDRRAFGIGDTMSDEANLAFGVDVDITLTATLAPQ